MRPYTCKLCFKKVEITSYRKPELTICLYCDPFQQTDNDTACYCSENCYGRHMKSHESIDIV